jgi:hypothetical protein
MKRIFVGAIALVIGATTWGAAQSLEDLNIQLHGYATQGFLYTTQNNFLTTESSNGSASWTEAVVNVTAKPVSKLRIGVQARYQLLGNYANGITLDWAAADYRENDRVGVRFGKVKVPSGLFNDIQDIDPAYLWALLPQSIYPLSSRNGQLATYGGVVYGTLNEFSPKVGQLEYRAWVGETSIPSNDGYFLAYNEEGITLPNGLTGAAIGEAIHWKTPLTGLMIGASDIQKRTETAALVAGGALPGTLTIPPFNIPDYFAHYEKNKLMVAAEYTRLPVSLSLDLAGTTTPTRVDIHGLYGMATYKLTGKLTGGLYNSQYFDHAAPLGPARYSKDWAVSGRYDFNQYLYAKAEEHFIDGTDIGYDTTLNPNGLKPDTRLTVLKIGVSF